MGNSMKKIAAKTVFWYEEENLDGLIKLFGVRLTLLLLLSSFDLRIYHWLKLNFNTKWVFLFLGM